MVTKPDPTAELVVDCGGNVGNVGTAAMPRIRFVRDRPPESVEGPWTWSSSVSETQRGSLDSLSLRTSGRLAPPGSGDVLLLAADSTPLIVQRHAGGVPLVETALEAESTDPERPAAPLLVALLVDRALSASLLDAVAVVAREERAIRVAPREDAIATTTAGATRGLRSRDWTSLLLVAGALVLLWELASLLRRRRRERVEAAAWSS